MHLSGQERTLLLVDDVEQVVTIAGDYLERRLKGLKVVTVTSPHDALAWLRQGHRVDLILSDNHMGDMDGLTLLQHARELRPEAVRALMTAYLDLDVTPPQLGAMGVHALIRKPWEWPELARFVARLVGLPMEERARLEAEGPIPFPATAFQELAAHRAGKVQAKRTEEVQEHRPLRPGAPTTLRPLNPPLPPEGAPDGSLPLRARPYRDAITGAARCACPACHETFTLDAEALVSGAGGAGRASQSAFQPGGPGASDEEEARRVLAFLRARPGVARHVLRAIQPPPGSAAAQVASAAAAAPPASAAAAAAPSAAAQRPTDPASKPK